MQSLGSAGFRHAFETLVGQNSSNVGRHTATFDDRYPFARIEVEHQVVGWTGNGAPHRYSPKRNMELDCGQVDGPDQCRKIANHEVLDGVAVGSGRHTDLPHPFGGVYRRVLLEERGLVDAVGTPLHGQRSISKVRQHDLGHLCVVAVSYTHLTL